jgi:hypothetical protein
MFKFDLLTTFGTILNTGLLVGLIFIVVKLVKKLGK